VTTAWTFRSAHVSGQDPVRVPLSAVRFAPALNSNQAAPAGVAFDLPVTVERQPGSAAAPVARLSVEVSYDDGLSWKPVPLSAGVAGWVGHLTHPDQGRFVSLRSTAVDTGGGTVEQTVIHAYRIG